MSELEASYLFKDVSLFSVYDRLKKPDLPRRRQNKVNELDLRDVTLYNTYNRLKKAGLVKAGK